MRKFRIKWRLLRLIPFVGKLVLLISTFLVGTAATFIYWKFLPPTITLCQLAQNPDFYRWKIVKVEADAIGGGFGAVTIEDVSCESLEAWAGVWREGGLQPDEKVQKLYSQPENEHYKARILVTGRFDPDATMGCFSPKAAIHATNIEVISEITTEPYEKPVKVVSKREIAASRFFAEFQKAVAANRRKQVAAMMQYPLRTNFYFEPRPTEYHFVENQAEFLKAYDRILANSVKDYIAKFNPEKVWGNDYFMQTDAGSIGIAVACKDNNGECAYDFKIKIIHSNSIEIDYQAKLCGGTLDCMLKADAEQNKRPPQ